MCRLNTHFACLAMQYLGMAMFLCQSPCITGAGIVSIMLHACIKTEEISFSLMSVVALGLENVTVLEF